jgi:hypothetical protein
MPTITFAHLDAMMRIVREPADSDAVEGEEPQPDPRRDVRQVEARGARSTATPGRATATTEER